uniref:Uncharacterized protein n=1 Tax=Pseudictyota dubia TaxID=2749911 RepID=A0A7R9ZAX3_9STRA|mmetsp:Transcript_37930/g.70022  ORF Transcript_37930/g.70022 Transcript_37930/m.70022 type:complete len:175 (+) Transcript_37930:137-661(+)
MKLRSAGITASVFVSSALHKPTTGFCPLPRIRTSRHVNGIHHPNEPFIGRSINTWQERSHKSWRRFAKKENQKIDPEYRNRVLSASEQRGNILFAASLLVAIWSFSIPVELRRTYWCYTDDCLQNRSACLDCLTFPEWCRKVIEFYETTDVKDWVHFDFTVNPDFMDNFNSMMN